MKKQYTRRQVQEAVRYWKAKLRRLDESLEYEGLREDLEGELSMRGDIPNYLKAYIHDVVLENAGHDGMDWDFEVQPFVNDFMRDRVMTLRRTDGRTVILPA